MIKDFERPVYRMYIDEVGNSDLGSSDDPNHRFLGLTGIIMKMDYVRDVFQPKLEKLKRYFFYSHPDDPIILHRKELMNKAYPFKILQDSAMESKFNKAILSLIEGSDFTVISVVIDKKAHKEQYTTWRFDPYHYCITVLIERYTLFLEAENTCGDVLAEARGGKEDKRLKKSFSRLYECGTDYVKPEMIRERLTSKELKVKPKKCNIAGLQLADLIAHPAYKDIIIKQNLMEAKKTFGKQVVEILVKSKYHRSNHGKIDGYGRKFLP